MSGKSCNEIVKRYLPKTAYFITYEESFSSRKRRQSAEEKEMLSVLSALYDELEDEMSNRY